MCGCPSQMYNLRRRGAVGLSVGGEAVSRLTKIGLGHDVVPLEDRARFVAADLHGDPLWDAGSDHVSDGSAPKVMKQHSGTSRARRTRSWAGLPAGSRSSAPERA